MSFEKNNLFSKNLTRGASGYIDVPLQQPGEAARLINEKSAAHEKIALSKINEEKERRERDQKAREERRKKKEEEERKKEEEQPKIQELTDEEADRLQKEIDSKKV